MEIGGRWLICWAVPGATPWAIRPELSVRGRVAARPAIMRLKKMPSEKTCAEFMKVEFIPPPAPRCRAGRLFITPTRLGAENAPMASPLSSRIPAKAG